MSQPPPEESSTLPLSAAEATVISAWLPAWLTYAMESEERSTLLTLQARITDFLTPTVQPVEAS